MQLRWFCLALASTLLVVGVGCEDSADDHASPTAVDLTNWDPAHDCSVDVGRQIANQLIVALNKGDLESVVAMMASTKPWAFDVVPSIRDTLSTSLEEAANQGLDVHAEKSTDLASVLSDFRGLTLSFTAPLDGGTMTDDGAQINLGPVLWQVTGDALHDYQLQSIEGGGKIAIDCTTGKFVRILLSPLKVQS